MTITIADLEDDLLASMRGYRPPADFESDGCTHCPQEFGPADLRPACLFHDYHYTLGGDERCRKNADRILWWNLKACGANWFVAGLYYRRVRFWGFSHFSYFPASARPGRLAQWRVFFTRWVTF